MRCVAFVGKAIWLCGRAVRGSAGLMVGFALSVSPLAATGTDNSRPLALNFNIPEQPLAAALQAYSAVSGVAVLYSSGLEAGRRSAEVKGVFTREAALRNLLGGSDLVVKYARADAVSLLDPATDHPDEPSATALPRADLALNTLHVTKKMSSGPDPAALTTYIVAIQRDIQEALQRSSLASSGNYRVGLQLWVDELRTVRRMEVVRSTGDTRRDGVIASSLQGLVLRQDAPARTPQPVSVMIVVTSR
jgi:hypothetical protein